MHHRTLAYAAYQNAKQEVFWAQVEGRLLAMLEGVRDLSLARLNEATQAWVELEYHRRLHRELGSTPLERYLSGPNIGRPSPLQQRASARLSRRGSAHAAPKRRHSLATRAALRGAGPLAPRRARPPALRQLGPLARRSRRRNHGRDPHRTLSARQARQRQWPAAADHADIDHGHAEPEDAPASAMAPLLADLLAEYAATGLPPAYLPKDVQQQRTGEDRNPER